MFPSSPSFSQTLEGPESRYRRTDPCGPAKSMLAHSLPDRTRDGVPEATSGIKSRLQTLLGFNPSLVLSSANLTHVPSPPANLKRLHCRLPTALSCDLPTPDHFAFSSFPTAHTASCIGNVPRRRVDLSTPPRSPLVSPPFAFFVAPIISIRVARLAARDTPTNSMRFATP